MLEFVFNHAPQAHWIIFCLFMLAGLNFPISEDLLIICSGVLASTVIPENTWKLFTAVFLGAYLSDVVVYALGRYAGHNLLKVKWFSKMLSENKLHKIAAYYARYGSLTLFVGRFIPFGVRNCLFATAGLGKMLLWKFLLFDGLACLLSNSCLFVSAYFFGKKISFVLSYINIILFTFFAIAIIALIWYKSKRVRT